MTETQELSGSTEIVFHEKDALIGDVTFHESTDADEFPFSAVNGHHP